MRFRLRTAALAIGGALCMVAGAASGPGRPSFDALAGTRHRALPGQSEPCGLHRPIAGICPLLRPVRS